MTQAGRQLAHLVGAVYFNAAHQIAIRDMTDIFQQALQRMNQRFIDAKPYGNYHCEHCNQHADHNPDRQIVRVVAAVYRQLIQAVVFGQVGVVGFFHAVLIALGRLVKEFIDFTGAQQLDQFRQRIVVNIIGTLHFLRGVITLAMIARQRFVRFPLLFRLLQRGLSNLHQLRDGRAAAHLVGIHHVTDTGTVQRVTGLDQRNPAGVQRGLLLTDSLKNGEIFLVVFQRVKEQPARR